jgi:hypothetical protein
MSTPERVIERTVDLVHRLSGDLRYRRRRRRQRRRRVFVKLVKTAFWMILAPLVIVPIMISKGWLFGPSGVEGLIAAPFVLFVTWAAILYWSLARRTTTPRAIVKADLAQLPAQTDAWLDEQRRLLPMAAQNAIESIALRLDALTPQLASMNAQQPAAQEIRRLLAEELPELVRGYQKLPRALQKQPLHGGLSPERQLVEGLATIDAQIGRMHEQLAADDLNALATHQRYLDLKYKRDDKLE